MNASKVRQDNARYTLHVKNWYKFPTKKIKRQESLFKTITFKARLPISMTALFNKQITICNQKHQFR